MAACPGGAGGRGVLEGLPRPSTTAPRPTTTEAATTTTAEHEAIQALRRYFDAYAHAVQTKDPDSILPYVDTSNRDAVTAATSDIRDDIAQGRSGSRTLSAAYLEFERINDKGRTIASVRAFYAKDTEARSQSFGFVRIESRWLLTAISTEGFQA